MRPPDDIAKEGREAVGKELGSIKSAKVETNCSKTYPTRTYLGRMACPAAVEWDGSSRVS